MKMRRFVLHGGGRAYLATGGDIFIFLYKASFFLAISYLGKKILKKTTSYHAKVTLATLTPTGLLILQTSTLLTASMSARLTQRLEHVDVDVSDSAMVISAIMMTMI